MEISLLTVTCVKDFDLLDRQLASAVEFLPSDSMYYIILNDDIKYLPELTSMVSKHLINNMIVHHSEFIELSVPLVDNCKFGERSYEGWVTQQVLKLTAAHIIQTPYYMILDSKDYFIQPTDPKVMIVDNKILSKKETFFHHWQETWDIFYKNSYSLLGLNPAECKHEVVQPHTPYIVNTQYVRDLINYFAEININLIDAVGLQNERTQGKCCEFYLYSAWLSKQNLISSSITWVEDDLPIRVEFDYRLRKDG